MKLNKLLSGVILSGIVLSLNVTDLGIGSTEAQAATVVSETQYVKTTLFDHTDIQTVTGVNLLTSSDVETVYTKLKDTASWTALGYSDADAKLIANRFTKSYNQAIGILTKMTKNNTLGLKVITTNKPYYKNASIGTGSIKDNSSSSSSSSSSESSSEANETTLSAQVKELEVEIEYSKKDIDLDYDAKSNGTIKAEVDNEVANIELKNAKAQAYIEDIFDGLDIKTADQDTIKNQVLSKLNADSNFKKFKFKAKLKDGSKVEFTIK